MRRVLYWCATTAAKQFINISSTHACFSSSSRGTTTLLAYSLVFVFPPWTSYNLANPSYNTQLRQPPSVPISKPKSKTKAHEIQIKANTLGRDDPPWLHVKQAGAVPVQCYGNRPMDFQALNKVVWCFGLPPAAWSPPGNLRTVSGSTRRCLLNFFINVWKNSAIVVTLWNVSISLTR